MDSSVGFRSLDGEIGGAGYTETIFGGDTSPLPAMSP